MIKKIICASVLIIYILINLYLLVDLRKQRGREEDAIKRIDEKLEALEKTIMASEEKKLKRIEASEKAIVKRIEEIEKVYKSGSVSINKRLKNIFKEEEVRKEKIGKKTARLLYLEEALEKKEEAGYMLLKEKKYGAAYKVYKEITDLDPERLRARYYCVYSLFYSNEMNKEKYAEILDEIKYLKSMGVRESSLIEIEDYIKREREIADESM